MVKMTILPFILTAFNLFAISMAFLTKSSRVQREIPGRASIVRSKANLFSTTDRSKFSTPSGAFGQPLSKETKKFNSSTIGFLKNFLFDAVFSGEKRDYARFYALETIARMPYFSYLSVLHLYETLGWWRKSAYLKIHFAESWNEMHHLLIMEELGGSKLWKDRFVAQHTAFFYYWAAVFLYLFNPTMAYNINQYVEEHAYSTYDNFLHEHEEELKKCPAPDIAKQYYRDGDLYMFDEHQMHTDCSPRRPVINNLYDVFVAIRDDEGDHVKTMVALQLDMELTSANSEQCMVPEES